MTDFVVPTVPARRRRRFKTAFMLEIVRVFHVFHKTL
jgi:hypothetical protein